MSGAQNRNSFWMDDNSPSPSPSCDELGEQCWEPQELLGNTVWIHGSGIVGTLGHKAVTKMKDAFVELTDDDDASSEGSESETLQVHNPCMRHQSHLLSVGSDTDAALFSHHATVDDLIASFHRNIIGPLAGVDIKEEFLTTSDSTPVLVISDADCQRTLDCALEKWRVEQEEKELEMRWRATKRLSENWLTKVEVVRERHKVRREKIAREKELRKKKAANGATDDLAAKDPATSSKTPQTVDTSLLQSSMQQLQPTYAVPGAGLAPLQLHSTACPPSTSTPRPTNNTIVPSEGSPSPLASLPTAFSNGHLSSIATDHALSARPQFPHVPYDPRAPDLALEELLCDVVDLDLPSPVALPESVEDSETLGGIPITEILSPHQDMILDYLQQYMDVAKMQMSSSPFLSHSSPRLQDPISALPLLPPVHSTPHTTLPDVVEERSTLSIQPEGALFPHSPQWLRFDGWLELTNTRFNPLLDQMELEALMSLIETADIPDGQLIQRTSTHANYGLHKPEPPVIVPVTPSEPTVEEMMIWHLWSLGQAPPGAGADVILSDLQAARPSDLTPMVLNLLPQFTGTREDAVRLKFLTGSPAVLEDPSTFFHTQLATMKAGWAWTSLSSMTIPLNEANTSLMLAPRSVLVNPAFSTLNSLFSSPSSQTASNLTASHDPPTLSVSPSVPGSRPSPVLKTHDLPPSLRTPSSYVDSPMSSLSTPTSTTALFDSPGESSNSSPGSYIPCMPIGDRLFRIARVANVDVLRPSYWFEPDVTATEHIRNLVDLMEEYGGWVR